MRKLLVPLLALVLVLAAAGCGDDGDGDGGDVSADAGAGDAAAGATPTLEGAVNDEGSADATGADSVDVEIGDSFFSPTFVQADPGASLTVNVSNGGQASHTFTIDGTDVDEELAAGDEVEVEVTVPEDGTAVFYCRFHRGGGMQGAFFSGDGGGAAGAGGGDTTTPTADDPGLDY